MKRLSVLLLVLFLLPGFSSALAATKPKPSPKENYPTEPGLHKDLAFTNAGQQRTFNLFIPSSYSKRGGKGMSLLFLLHGAGMDADEMSKNSMVEVAEAEGFITVIPDWSGYPEKRYWNHGLPVEIPSKPEFMIRNQDDVGFMKNLAEKLKKQLRVDPSRLYVTGISDGGMMTHLLAAELPETFAAAAPIAGLSQLRASINAPLQTIGVPRAPIPMVIAQGTADKYVPYIGGKCANPDSNNLVGSFADTIRFWLDGNRATSSMPSSTELNAKKGYMLSIYDSGKAPVIAITVINGTHSWGKNGIMTSRDFSEIIWEQLSKFTKAKRTITPTDGGM